MIIDGLYGFFKNDPTLKRHLFKTVSWRIIGSIDTVLLGWLITGKMATGFKIGSLELFTKVLLYFLHERAWHRTKFGLPTRIHMAQRAIRSNKGKLFQQNVGINRDKREEQNGNVSFTIWLTGLSGSGKSTIANELDKWFFSFGLRSYVIDGDNTRLGINSDLTFSDEDRSENIRRVAEICRLFNEAGTIVIASFISPFKDDRERAASIIGAKSFIETYIDANIETCKSRDTKGLYALANEGKLKNFTGISSPYEEPAMPAIHLHTDQEPLDVCVRKIVDFLCITHISNKVKTST